MDNHQIVSITQSDLPSKVWHIFPYVSGGMAQRAEVAAWGVTSGGDLVPAFLNPAGDPFWAQDWHVDVEILFANFLGGLPWLPLMPEQSTAPPVIINRHGDYLILGPHTTGGENWGPYRLPFENVMNAPDMPELDEPHVNGDEASFILSYDSMARLTWMIPSDNPDGNLPTIFLEPAPSSYLPLK